MRADTRRRQIKKHRRAEPAGADHQHARALERGLSRPAHLAQHDMARIALEFFGCQHRSYSNRLLQSDLLHMPPGRGHLVTGLVICRRSRRSVSCAFRLLHVCWRALSVVFSLPAQAQAPKPEAKPAAKPDTKPAAKPREARGQSLRRKARRKASRIRRNRKGQSGDQGRLCGDADGRAAVHPVRPDLVRRL